MSWRAGYYRRPWQQNRAVKLSYALSASKGRRRSYYASRRARGLALSSSRVLSLGRARSLALRNMRTGGLLGIERKFFNAAIPATGLVSPADCSGGEIQPDTGCTGCLSAPAQGDGPENRDGKQIALLSINFQGVVYLTGLSGQTSVSSVAFPDVYLALVLSTQTNGTTIVSEDVFVNVTGESVCAGMPFMNMSNTSRFRLLKVLRIPGSRFAGMVAANNAVGTTISVSSVQIPVRLYASLKGIKVNFTTGGTTADVANVVDNSIHLIGYTSSGSMAPYIAGASRMRFIG